MNTAKITIGGPGKNFDDRLFGRWWWKAQIGTDRTMGSARTEQKARQKAERAAAKLAKKISRRQPHTYTDYEIEVQP